MRARLRLGRVASCISAKEAAHRRETQEGGQLFLDTVYAASDRTEGFKGGFVVYCAHSLASSSLLSKNQMIRRDHVLDCLPSTGSDPLVWLYPLVCTQTDA